MKSKNKRLCKCEYKASIACVIFCYLITILTIIFLYRSAEQNDSQNNILRIGYYKYLDLNISDTHNITVQLDYTQGEQSIIVSSRR